MNVVNKKDLLKRYSLYWLDLTLRALLPVGVTIWQFGLFKTEVGFFSRMQGTTIVALFISFWICKDDLLEWLQGFENLSYYKAVRRTAIALLVLGVLIWSRNFFDEMIWVVGSFAFGSGSAIATTVLHTKYKERTTKKKEGI